MRLVTLSALSLWAGAALLLSGLRWFSRPSLADRLRPYSPGGLSGAAAGPGAVNRQSWSELVGPLARDVGERVARAFGAGDDLALKLERIHSPLDPTTFRVRQLGAALAAAAVAAVFAGAAGLPSALAAVVLLGAPLMAFLVVEQRLAGESARWQRRLFLELPVVSEQLAMLLSAGYSLGAALNRVAERGAGASSADLRRVVSRVHHGLTEIDALREWADVARVDALDRLIPVLALNREAGDLGRLLSGEARSIRRDAQRQMVETMESRGQKVWIPVTVATLIPGVIFLSIPFIEALSLFSGS